MPAMKVNLSAAMRARDVSRPRPEQLADAEAFEVSISSSVSGPRRNVTAADKAGSARDAAQVREAAQVRARESADQERATRGSQEGRSEGTRRRRTPSAMKPSSGVAPSTC